MKERQAMASEKESRKRAGSAASSKKILIKVAERKEKMQENLQNKTGITGSTLKWIAVISMLIDHSAYVLLGKVLVENGIFYVGNLSFEYIKELMEQGSIGWVYLAYQILRQIIGRIAFPIYCFLLVEGFFYTRSRKKYAGRLLLFCLISEVPFDLAFYGETWYKGHQNVFFTLFLGFLFMWSFETMKLHIKNKWLAMAAGIAAFVVFAGAAELISSDYGYLGVMAIALFYLARNNKMQQLLMGGIAFCWEPGALLSLIPIGMYNRKKGSSMKYFFYLFYPVHLLLLRVMYIYL